MSEWSADCRAFPRLPGVYDLRIDGEVYRNTRVLGLTRDGELKFRLSNDIHPPWLNTPHVPTFEWREIEIPSGA